MRATLIFLVVALVLVAGFVYWRNPAGCGKLATDLGAIPSSGFAPVQADLGALLSSAPTTLDIASAIDGHLVSADGSPFSFPAGTPPGSIQYYAFFYSADWCPPCHTFTPVLADWYKKFKPAHPNFELIFVSDDTNKTAWLAHMKAMAMPWPAYAFDDLAQTGKPIHAYEGSGIPDLILVDANGKVLADTFSAFGTYRSPDQVLPEIETILGPGTPPPPAPAPPPTPAPKPVITFAPAPKAWTPPDVIPAQPNWTWTTSDGTTYQNVVVTKIGAELVSITHAMGVTHDIPIANLPPSIQKQLNYDPAAAAIARKEAAREAAHPYYLMSEQADARAVADQMHWPLAWLSSYHVDLNPDISPTGEQAELSQMALNYIKDKSIVIVIDPDKEMPQTPPIVHHQFSKFDDGALPGGANYMVPKIVFSTTDATILGRVSYTQMQQTGKTAIAEVMDSFRKDAPAPPILTPTTNSAPPAPAAPESPAPTAVAPPSASPSPAPFQPWTPPAVLPAQPDWIWTTSDGTIYQQVVITKLGPETVSITHAMGVAHDIPLSNLPPDVQKKLNYDPAQAAAARAERKREDAHPYYPLAQSADALTVAHQMHWPVAWIDSFAEYLSDANPVPDSEVDFTQRAINVSKTHAIVIFASGGDDLGKLPPLVHAQMIIMDDGPDLPGGHHFYAPKIVVTDPDISTPLGRVSYTQMKGGGDAAIEQVFTSPPTATTPSTNAPASTAP